MDSLPSEIIHAIIQHLSTKRWYDYLTVSKQWYSVVLPMLYTDICLGHREAQLCLASARSTFPRAGKYLRTLAFKTICRPRNQYGIKLIMQNAVHVESLDYGSYDEFLDYLNDADVDVSAYSRLSHIIGQYSGHDVESYNVRYTLCMSKFKDNITTVEVNESLYCYIIKSDGLDGVLDYIHQFQKLNKLVLNIACLTNKEVMPLSEILDNSHHVSELVFYPSRNYSIQLHSIYPFITHFTLGGGEWDQELSESIVPAFPNLEMLRIKAASPTELDADIKPLLTALLASETFSTCFIVLSGLDHLYCLMFVNFFYTIADCYHWNHTLSIFCELEQENGSQIKVELDKRHTTSKVTYACNNYQFHLSLYGMCLRQLSISKCGYPSVNLGTINKLCPNLTRLSVKAGHARNTLQYVNTYLTELSVQFIVDQSIFKDIQVVYPNLETLELVYVDHPDSIKSLQVSVALPHTPLKRVLLNKWHLDYCDYRIIIQRVVDDIPVYQWEYGAGHKSIIESTKPRISPSLIPTFVYTHPTIRSVSLNHSDEDCENSQDIE